VRVENHAGRRVAITGGTGFIGRRLVDAHLVAGDEVRVLTRRPDVVRARGSRTFAADLAEAPASALAAFVDGVDVLYHCAGELRDVARMERVHVGGTARLLDAAAGRVPRWVQLSSVGVYGRRRRGAVTEETPCLPVGAYEETKARSDDLVLEAAARGALDAVILRPSIVIGAGMPSRSLWGMLEAVQRGVFAFIGRRGASANYVPVDEVASALQLVATVDGPLPSPVYNLSQWLTIEDFVAAMAAAIDVPRPTRRIPEWAARGAALALGRVPGFPLTSSRVDALTSFAKYPAHRLAAELRYAPRRTVPDALRDVVAEWRSAG
jgi:nucleoside-diphosphate-sugar epimerase